MKSCKKCGSLEFYKCGHCKPCRIKYSRDYQIKNHSKVKQTKAKNYLKNIERNKAKSAKYYSDNKNGKVAEYQEKNKKIISLKRAKWRELNKEKRAFDIYNWKLKNKESCRIYDHNKRARKKLNGGRLSQGLAEKLFKLQRGKCACCGKPLGKDYHLDHRMPLALGGANEDSNIQLLRDICNLSKSKKHPIDFMQEKGFLL